MPEYTKNYIILHHSLTARDTTTFEAINNNHRAKWDFESSLGFYIGYHYFINGQGTVTQGRADLEAGAHCYQSDMNYKSIGICLAGNFDIEEPSAAQLKSLAALLDDLMRKHGIPIENLKFHREYAPKSCPGTKIGADFFKKLLINDDSMKLVQKKGQREVYAIDKNNKRHAIVNWETFQRGLAMGIWENKIDQIDDLTPYKAGNLIVITPDN